MADDGEDPYSFIIHHCRYSISQEDLLQRSNFARQDATVIATVAGESPPPAEHSVVNQREFDGEGGSGGSRGGGNENDSAVAMNLGFGGERKESPKLKKGRGLGGEEGSPMVHCSGKVVINRDGDESEVLVFEGDVEVKMVNPLRCVAPDGAERSVENLGSQRGGEGAVDSGVKKKLEFEGCTQVIEVEGEGNVEIVDTEVIAGGEEGANDAKIEGGDDVDTEMVEGDGGTSKDEEVVCVDTEVVEGDEVVEMANSEAVVVETEEEGVNCAKVDGGGSEEDEIADVDTEVVGVEEGVENRVKFKEFANVVDTVMLESEEEGGNCAKVSGETEVIGSEQEGGNCSKVDGETSKHEEVANQETEVIVIEEEEENCADVGGEKTNVGQEDEEEMSRIGRDGKQGSGKAEEGTRMREEEEVKRGEKRKLPRSMFEQWFDGLRNGEGCSKDERVEGKGTEKSEEDSEASTAVRCILDVLKFLAGEKSSNGDDGEVDIFETAKRRGMTFPRPRFRQSMEDDA